MASMFLSFLQMTPIVLAILILFSLNLNTSVYSQVAQNAESNLNITQDMLDLIASATGIKHLEEVNSDSNSNNTSIKTNINENRGELINVKDFLIKPSQSIFLEDKNLPEGSLMYIYDVSPYIIAEAQLTAKLPCNDLNNTFVEILGGKIPNFDRISPKYIPQFSISGDVCLYQGLIDSNATAPISEIALFNNSSEDIEFSPTTAIVISFGNLTRME